MTAEQRHGTYVQTSAAGGFFAWCTVCGSGLFPNRMRLAQAEADARAHGELHHVCARERLVEHEQRDDGRLSFDEDAG